MNHVSLNTPMRGLIAAVAFALASLAMPASAEGFPAAATSQEYKLALKPELFADPTQAFTHYWEVAKKVAIDNGLGVEEEKLPLREKSSVQYYLDNAKFSLDGKGYILRVVQADGKGRLADKVAVTLKFRSPDPARIKADTIEISALGDVETEYQDDVIGFIGSAPGKNVTEHSLSAKFKGIPAQPELTTLGDFAALFPTLNKLGLDVSTPLTPVGGELRSQAVEPGEIIFRAENGDALDAEIALTYWTSLADGKGIVGEISFSVDLKHASPKTIADFQKYFAALQTALASDLMPGTSKVALLYALGKKK